MDKLEQLKKLWGEDYKVAVVEVKKEFKITVHKIRIDEWVDEYIRIVTIKKDHIVTKEHSKIHKNELQKINETYKIMGWE